MKYGLEEKEIEKLKNIFYSFPHIEQVYLYGSRAKGNYKPFSDVDITLEGDALTYEDLTNLYLQIDDLLLPYHFDISILKNLKDKDLKDHISRRGILFYSKT